VDRDEAIAALVSLPATTRISVAAIQPSDVIVIECDERLSMETMNNIKALVGTVWPANKAIVIDKGLRLKIAEKEHE
jgi:hypothetical protein